MVFRGRSGGEFSVKGPAHRPKVRPVYRGLQGQVKFGWASGEVQAVELGKAELLPSFKDGLLLLPVADIPASGGTVRLGGSVDLTGKDPILKIPGVLQLMKDVPLDIDLRKKGTNLLRWINPISYFSRNNFHAKLLSTAMSWSSAEVSSRGSSVMGPNGSPPHVASTRGGQ